MKEAGSPLVSYPPRRITVHPYSCVIANRSQGLDWNTLDVSPLCRCFIAELDKVPTKFRECWTTAEKLALRLKVSVRSIARAQSEAVAKGLVSVVRNYGLRARRALLLLWRSPAPAPVPAVEVASAPDYAPAPVAQQKAPGPVAVDPPQPERPRETPRRPSGPKVREATGQERQLVLKAEAKYGPAMSYPVLLAVDRFGCYWVSMAIEQSRAGVRWAYTLKMLEGWQSKGGPPKKAEEQSEDRWERLGRIIQEQWEKCHGIAAKA